VKPQAHEPSVGIEIPVNDISAEDMFGVRVWVAEEVGEGDGREGVVVVTCLRVYFHACVGVGGVGRWQAREAPLPSI
jgi:hypothetical protein